MTENNSEFVSFTYGEFYDVPRQLTVVVGRDVLFLRSFFDDALDGYRPYYDVFLVDAVQNATFVYRAGGVGKESIARSHLGVIPVSGVVFDSSRRKELDVVSSGILALLRKRGA